jgi:hypothetical protein
LCEIKLVSRPADNFNSIPGMNIQNLISVKVWMGNERHRLQRQIYSRVNGNWKSETFGGPRTGWDSQDNTFHEVESKLNHTLQ